MNTKHEQPAGPHTADAIAQRSNDKHTRDDARRIAAAWKEDKKRIAELETALKDKAIIAHALSRKVNAVGHDGYFNECPSEYCRFVRDLLNSKPTEAQHGQ